MLILLPVLLPPTGVRAEGLRPAAPEWELSADSLSHQLDPSRVTAEGNVVLSRPQEHGEPLVIRADQMVYDPESGTVEARGRVRLESTTEEVEAEGVVLHLESQTGTLEQATIHLVESGVYVRGAHIEKTGPESYYLEDAWYSACRPEEDCRPAWSLKSSKVYLTVDGLAHFVHPRLQVKEVPVLYSPYLMAPANVHRQSGFLAPELSTSRRRGDGLALPYFVNLSPSADLTLYPKYMDRRGLQSGVEFRYAAAPGSLGMFQFTYLKDKHQDTADDPYRNDGWLRDSSQRYWLRGKADHDFGDDLLLRLDLDLVSDQDYIMEFDSGLMGYARSTSAFESMFDRELQEPSLATRRSTLQLFRLRPTTLVAGELMGQQDSRHTLNYQGQEVDRNRRGTPLQALPRLHASGRSPMRSQPYSLAWSNEYVHYWRQEGIGAHRLDLHPQLIVPLPRGGGWTEGRATTGVRQTMYQVNEHDEHRWEYDRYQDRTAFDFETNLATTLVRDFRLAPQGPSRAAFDRPVTSPGLEHMVRPNLIYSYVSRSSESELPELDSVDRLERKNWLTYELNNYFEVFGYRASPPPSPPAPDDSALAINGPAEPEPLALPTSPPGDFWSRPLAFFKMMQTYDIDEARRDLEADESRRELSDLRFDLQASPLPSLDLRYQTNLSMYGQGVNRYELQGTYRRFGGSLTLNYRYLKHSGMREPYFYTEAGDSRHDVRAGFTAPLGDSLTFRGMINKSLTEDYIADASFGVTYHPHCWAVEMEVRRYVDEKSFMVVFTLDTLGEIPRWLKRGI
ncbi:LPS-assembly protein LptD [Desulfurivibrio alkaliphilus]|uniref:LPS-assembly protein LptD n=1 Tax=Desulfurivibrio alkaliphilus TaxID=427923 RepID=UPI00030B2ABD|nr:LPS assembly protein LptD [Desulfurivibrio alkaliphilus]